MYGRNLQLGGDADEPFSLGREIERKPSNLAPLEVRQRNLSSGVVSSKLVTRERLITRNSSIRIGITDSMDSIEKQDDEGIVEPPSSSPGRTPTAWIQPKVDSEISLQRESNSITYFKGKTQNYSKNFWMLLK